MANPTTPQNNTVNQGLSKMFETARYFNQLQETEAKLSKREAEFKAELDFCQEGCRRVCATNKAYSQIIEVSRKTIAELREKVDDLELNALKDLEASNAAAIIVKDELAKSNAERNMLEAKLQELKLAIEDAIEQTETGHEYGPGKRYLEAYIPSSAQLIRRMKEGSLDMQVKIASLEYEPGLDTPPKKSGQEAVKETQKKESSGSQQVQDEVTLSPSAADHLPSRNPAIRDLNKQKLRGHSATTRAKEVMDVKEERARQKAAIDSARDVLRQAEYAAMDKTFRDLRYGRATYRNEGEEGVVERSEAPAQSTLFSGTAKAKVVQMSISSKSSIATEFPKVPGAFCNDAEDGTQGEGEATPFSIKNFFTNIRLPFISGWWTDDVPLDLPDGRSPTGEEPWDPYPRPPTPSLLERIRPHLPSTTAVLLLVGLFVAFITYQIISGRLMMRMVDAEYARSVKMFESGGPAYNNGVSVGTAYYYEEPPSFQENLIAALKGWQ